tara:strand:- start:344 stop:490 length:147 start_codon:yes stop_codon:yes gene_type:complete
MIDKDEQHSKQCLKKTLKSDLKPWIPAVSSLEAFAISRQYLQIKTEEE